VENSYILQGGRTFWLKLQNDEIYISGFSPNIIKNFKSRRKKLADQAAGMGEARNHLKFQTECLMGRYILGDLTEG
jgi:hypothetical protein